MSPSAGHYRGGLRDVVIAVGHAGQGERARCESGRRNLSLTSCGARAACSGAWERGGGGACGTGFVRTSNSWIAIILPGSSQVGNSRESERLRTVRSQAAGV